MQPKRLGLHNAGGSTSPQTMNILPTFEGPSFFSSLPVIWSRGRLSMCPGLRREIPPGDLGILLMGDIDIAVSPHPWNDALRLRAHPRFNVCTCSGVVQS